MEEKEILTEEEIPTVEGEAVEPDIDEAPEAEVLSEKETELTAKVADLEDQLLRKIAEFDNYRRRTTKEKEEIGLTAKVKCIGELLPVLDNFERALAVGSADESFLKGVQMIFDSMVSTLKKMGVEEIEAEGKPFNPDLHYAVTRVENPELEANTIAAVLQKGYQMSGKIIRHAMVAVANPD
ncbi:MAG: nucleotide exchange factor GrpE [Oscillospiraceae bacterium]|nr:nucleotide exchange factor GrpE [Oscillospiraceae bacterium]